MSAEADKDEDQKESSTQELGELMDTIICVMAVEF